ncbi:uncharacterized protein LOC110707502 isoform X2 [Chenopodium quinoa]|uniref:uncharacterized protein LOC110707502 isoform X2 n=1 Tax=Chenopodium quinoa TaxID=63459 RepID=UPI000B79A47C|nr:uncharacterized protein LOC110707502 isoform X2 [Chenopodium quinoa]
MIYYLDHLHRDPVKWGVYPRVKVWNCGGVNATLLEDKVSINEYGKLLVIDIAYGEEHPLVPRETEHPFGKVSHAGIKNKAPISGGTDQASIDDVVERVLVQLSTRLEPIVEGLIGKAFSGFLGKMTGGNDYLATGSPHCENVGSTGRPREQVNPTKYFDGNEFLANGRTHGEKVGSTGPKELTKKFGVGYSFDNMNKSPHLEEGHRPQKLSLFEKRLLCIVRGWKELKNDQEPGPNLILCDGIDTSQRDCYRVVSPRSRVGDHYVRMAVVLYTKTRASQHTRKRIMMDPSYANFVMIGKDDPKVLGQKYGKTFLGYPLYQIQSVFVPFLDTSKKNAEHWYCLALDLKA